MYFRVIIFDVLFHEIKEGKENGWEWFDDPHKNLLVLQMTRSQRPENMLFEEILEDHEMLAPYVARHTTDPSHALFISDDEFRLRWARNQGFQALAITSKKKETFGERYACGPDGDGIIGMIYLIRDCSHPLTNFVPPYRKKR